MISDYTVALFGHILGVLIFVSGIVLASLPYEIARRRSDPGEIATILGLARAGVPLVGTGATMLLGFGLWLVHVSGFGYRTGWVQAALGLFAFALILGGAGGHRPKRARIHAAKLASERQPADAELRRLLHDPISQAINYASAIAILAILVLMVFKP